MDRIHLTQDRVHRRSLVNTTTIPQQNIWRTFGPVRQTLASIKFPLRYFDIICHVLCCIYFQLRFPAEELSQKMHLSKMGFFISSLLFASRSGQLYRLYTVEGRDDEWTINWMRHTKKSIWINLKRYPGFGWVEGKWQTPMSWFRCTVRDQNWSPPEYASQAIQLSC